MSDPLASTGGQRQPSEITSKEVEVKKKTLALNVNFTIDERRGHPNIEFVTQFNVPGTYPLAPNHPQCFLNKLEPREQSIIKDGVRQSWNIMMNTPRMIPNLQAPIFVPPNFHATAPGSIFQPPPVVAPNYQVSPYMNSYYQSPVMNPNIHSPAPITGFGNSFPPQ
ncbi:unnamed protein product [Orchesella dallaii]|uniref:Uncharacterized protein n=1 Tax=Orchesella dallaii TaxID=48710 RepID=A0ABP1RLB2_9HEXA